MCGSPFTPTTSTDNLKVVSSVACGNDNPTVPIRISDNLIESSAAHCIFIGCVPALNKNNGSWFTQQMPETYD